MQEIWKDIPNYEGYYQVSNLGRVKSLERYRSGREGCKILLKEKILKPKTDRYGYLTQALCVNKKMKHIPIHRLVALAFITNNEPERCNQINHIDGNKKNNIIENLEWCDVKYNVNEAIRLGLRGNGKPYKPRIDSTPINQYEKSGKLIRLYQNLAEASRESGLTKNSICNCLRGWSKSSGGYVWEYATKNPSK